MSNAKLHCFNNLHSDIYAIQLYISVLKRCERNLILIIKLHLSASSSVVIYRFSSGFLNFLHTLVSTHTPLIFLLLSVITLSCILSLALIFVYDLFRPGLAGAQVYNWSSPGCRFYRHGWRWLPALGLRGLGGCRRSWGATWCRVGPAGTGPSTGV